ncbi:putative lipoate-protein ligase A [Anatilimnocola aggregata]|uniref:Putative lipoate-protein ligase A n=1 Tax=Anatilimnocola aggregata TaxID=2528021 RepID=A0A517YMZ7_9BACT|nr:lipoate--protein ligase family protein [Anatilimnocola aggregata]QDU31597.1 putative lipoate-protein ligase A [Anatilimnocola aggregata]
MLLLDLTLPTAAENLALDEALLDSVDEQPAAPELLRLWECPQTAVVLGRSCRAAEEVDLAACEQADIPVLRRTSGGGTVLIGPGCLMFSLRLSYLARPHFRLLDQAHHEVLTTVAAAVNSVIPNGRIEPRGTSDLAIGETKVSGNSLRCKRNFLLYHGTLLYDFDLTLVQQLLHPPPRQPEYRHQRPHRDFVTNLSADPLQLRSALAHHWQATKPTSDWPQELTARLERQRYGRAEWNLER